MRDRIESRARSGAPTVTDLARERTRARAARKLLPWAFASVAAAGLLVYVAGGGWKGALGIFAPGLLFVVFAWSASVARCPGCGTRLPRVEKGTGPAAAPGPVDVEDERGCPRCRSSGSR
jgi:hypothetical protein